MYNRKLNHLLREILYIFFNWPNPENNVNNIYYIAPLYNCSWWPLQAVSIITFNYLSLYYYYFLLLFYYLSLLFIHNKGKCLVSEKLKQDRQRWFMCNNWNIKFQSILTFWQLNSWHHTRIWPYRRLSYKRRQTHFLTHWHTLPTISIYRLHRFSTNRLG